MSTTLARCHAISVQEYLAGALAGKVLGINWSPQMQTAWPHFIQGVGELWLSLIRELYRSGTRPAEPLARHAAIEKALDAMWRTEGGHALLHHLSAAFGNQERLVTRRELMRFRVFGYPEITVGLHFAGIGSGMVKRTGTQPVAANSAQNAIASGQMSQAGGIGHLPGTYSLSLRALMVARSMLSALGGNPADAG